VIKALVANQELESQAGGMVQVIEHLPSKHQALNLNHSMGVGGSEWELESLLKYKHGIQKSFIQNKRRVNKPVSIFHQFNIQSRSLFILWKCNVQS
jgi:hypothetical protein